MRVLLVPAVVVGVLVTPGVDEPSAADMRTAFAATLDAQVQSALAYVAETGGEAALARVRATRTDAFDIRSFTKLDCTPAAARPDEPTARTAGHVCGFSVRVDVIDGLLAHAMIGRFYAGPQGLVFEDVPREGA